MESEYLLPVIVFKNVSINISYCILVGVSGSVSKYGRRFFIFVSRKSSNVSLEQMEH